MRVVVLRTLRRLFPRLMLRRALSHDWWSELEETMLPAVVDPNRSAVDVGAHAGSYTVRLARLARKVYAFEPNQEMADLLDRATPQSVVVSTDAVSDTEGWKTFHVPVECGRASTTLGSLAPLDVESTLTRRVRTTTLDQLVDEDIGFIKVDVEGHEAQVLAGARSLIRRRRPVFLLEANHADDLARLTAFFADQDYTGFFLHPDGGTRPLTSLTPDLQDRSELARPVPRQKMRFVNNFFFAPTDLAIEIRRRLNGMK